MLNIIKAEPHEFSAVRGFYWELIDKMREAPYKPGWEKGVYPADDYIDAAIKNGQLFLGMADERIVSAMIVDSESNEGYVGTNWGVEAGPDEVMLIHALGVMPEYAGRGFAKAMVRYAVHIAQQHGCKAVRLDVLAGNVPAERLYPSVGFKHVRTVKMFYEDTGWTDFLLYEYVI